MAEGHPVKPSHWGSCNGSIFSSLVLSWSYSQRRPFQTARRAAMGRGPNIQCVNDHQSSSFYLTRTFKSASPFLVPRSSLHGHNQFQLRQGRTVDQGPAQTALTFLPQWPPLLTSSRGTWHCWALNFPRFCNVNCDASNSLLQPRLEHSWTAK